MLFGIYQTILVNFGREVYTGTDRNSAIEIAKRSGFECSVLFDGELIATYSPISGLREYT